MRSLDKSNDGKEEGVLDLSEEEKLYKSHIGTWRTDEHGEVGLSGTSVGVVRDVK